MKKFFTMLLLTLAIALPARFAEAADVPGFYQFGSDYLYSRGIENSTGKRSYKYGCSVDLNENFAEQYVRYVTTNYDFELTGHYFNDYRRTSLETFEWWILIYTGSKDPYTFTQNIKHNQNYNANLVVCRHKNWEREDTRFYIKVANGLTYGED